MSLEGRLQIHLEASSEGVGRVTIGSSRPPVAERLFPGKTPAQVLDTLPRIYSVCAMAHCRAALQASREALGLAPDGDLLAAYDFLVDVETVREHGLRMLMAWPGLQGEAAQAPAARYLVQSLSVCREGLFPPDHAYGVEMPVVLQGELLDAQLARLEQTLRTEVFAMPTGDWLALATQEELARWALEGKTAAARYVAWILGRGWGEAGTNSVPFLPPTSAEALHVWLDGNTELAHLPTWHEHPHETTCLGRCYDHPLVRQVVAETGRGLLARVTARLVETARTMERLKVWQVRFASILKTDQATAATGGRGLGQVEAARGRLIHRLELREGRVADYRIVAPTEWNFHPQGSVAQALGNLRADSAASLREQAAMVVYAIDPCVGFDLSIDYA